MRFTIGSGCVPFTGAVLVAIVAMGGCGSGPTGDGTDVSSRSSNLAASLTEVGSVSVSDAKVTFYSLTRSGHTDVGMMESGSAFATRTLVAPLLAQRLTTQEIYLALAPNGTAPPPALVAAQADEAAAMGRSAEVQHVTLDTSVLVEKDATWCKNLVYSARPPPDGNNPYFWNTDISQYISGQGTSYWYPFSGPGNYTDEWVIVGACNEGSASVRLWFAEFGQGASGDWVTGQNGTVMPSGYYAYWYWRNPGGAYYWWQGKAEYPASTGQWDMILGNEVYIVQ
jgi:hypothetical protein